VRAKLYLTGRLMLDEPLGNTVLPWRMPCTVVSHGHLTSADRVNFEEALSLIGADPEHEPPLLPRHAKNGTLKQWTRQTKALADELGVAKPSKAFPYASSAVIRLLTKPDAVENLWPTAKQLLAVQERLLRETFKTCAKQGHVPAAMRLLDDYGFSWAEAVALVSMSKEHAVEIFRGTPEQERALAVARAEDVLERAGNAFDRRGEINATKQIGLFVGVTRSEVEDVQVEFAKLAGRINNPPAIPQRPASAAPLVLDVSPEKPSTPA